MYDPGNNVQPSMSLGQMRLQACVAALSVVNDKSAPGWWMFDGSETSSDQLSEMGIPETLDSDKIVGFLGPEGTYSHQVSLIVLLPV